MKRSFILIIVLAVILPTMLSAQSASVSHNVEQEEDTLYDWSESDVEYLREHKGEFANKKMNDIRSFLQQRDMNIGGLWGWGTSPWCDPYHHGNSYIRIFYIFSRDFDDLLKGDSFYRINIQLDLPENDTTVIFGDFWRSFDPGKSEVEQFFEKTKNLPVREIEVEMDSIRF